MRRNPARRGWRRAPGSGNVATEEMPAEVEPEHSGRRIALLTFAVIAVVGVVAAIVILGTGNSSPPAARADTSAGQLVARIPLGAEPASVGVGREGVWVGTLNGAVLHVDPRARKVV